MDSSSASHQRLLLLLLVALLTAVFLAAGPLTVRSARAQQGGSPAVQGQVTDAATGDPLPGVNVVVQGTTIGTTTGAEGNYQLSVPSLSDTLNFSFVGYSGRTEPIDGRTKIDVALSSQVIQSEELVVVGYGQQRASELTSSVGSVAPEELTNVTETSTEALLQGKVSGVTVTTGGGDPNQETSVVIRGTGTFGNDQPLYVIDGVKTNSMANLDPDNIESLQVLKGASAAAIYGSRAANGVVIVTTKSGEDATDGVRVRYSGRVGMQNPINTLDFLNAEQYRQHSIEYHRNDNQPIPPFAQEENFDPSVSTDWQDVWLRAAPLYQNNLNISAGNENASVFISGEQLKRDGVVENTSFERYSFRVNSNYEKGRFSIRERLSVSRAKNNPNSYYGRERGALPVIPIRNEENQGGFAGVRPAYHGVARGINWYGVSELNQNRTNTDNVIGSLITSFDITGNLTYELTLGLDYQVYNNSNYTPAFFQSTSQEAFNDEADLSEYTSRQFDTIIENTLTFSKDLGNHSLDVLGGYTEERDHLETESVDVTSFPNNNVRTIAGANEVVNVDGGTFESRLRSGFGRINYNYAGKYLVSGTARADGSSRFTEGNRWGTFYSASLGWQMAQESFFPDFFDGFKPRVSYGKLGNQEIGAYETIPGLNVNASAYFAGGAQPGTALLNLSNPNLQWETTTTTNIGIDAEFLDNRASVTMNWFNKDSENVLASVPIPTFGGVGQSVTTNAAALNNRGFEFAGSYGDEYENGFSFEASGNLSTIRNEVQKLGEGLSAISGGGFTQQGYNATRTEPGHPIASFYGYVVEGIYQSKEEAEASDRPNVRPGDFKFKDLDGDGLPDKTFIGNPHPDFEFGFNFDASYKRFNAGLFVQGVQGNDVWNSTLFQYVLDNAGGTKLAKVLDSWTPKNTDTNIPRATLQDPAGNKRSSSFYVEDGSYVRLKSLQFGYEPPISVAGGEYRVYVRAENLLTLASYSGYDPEVGRSSGGLFSQGLDQNAHPRPRTFTLGINATF
jgi:TonB-linked SusC/RagA family outer membrane protein